MSTVISISRQLGSQSRSIAAEVAEKLGLSLIDREVIHRAANIAGYPDQRMIDMLEEKERVPGLLTRIRTSITSITSASINPSPTMREQYVFEQTLLNVTPIKGMDKSTMKQIPDDKERAKITSGYFSLIRQVIQEIAGEGNAIILGRGGQAILKDLPNTLHILITAPMDLRIHRLTERMNIEAEEAEKQIAHNDLVRSKYLTHFANVEWEDLALYDLIINTNKISKNQAVKMICDTAHQITG